MTPERLKMKLAQLERVEERARQLRSEITAGCRAYSEANGLRVFLTPEQVLRDVAYAPESAAA